MNKIWIPLFSHSGSEVAQLFDKQFIVPHLILSNQKDISKINERIQPYTSLLTIKDINEALEAYAILSNPKKVIYTLHGYMGIIPSNIIDLPNVEIYNVHPGDIVKYPELRGKDPQQKALDLGLKTTGVVIHRVDAGIDTGEVIKREEYKIKNNLTLDELIVDLRVLSVKMWLQFMKEKFI